MRRRGLKPGLGRLLGAAPGVASHAEAWIETSLFVGDWFEAGVVASHAEAWIETCQTSASMP